ncbi:esterase-like activity of phytase family protein [Paracoccaceae bacterium GXU_MW_L88]
MIRIIDLITAAILPISAGSPALELDGRAVLRSDTESFGGLSAIEITEDGDRFVAVSDRGQWWMGEITRENGRITAARPTERTAIRTSRNMPVPPVHSDAEGMARLPSGEFFLSFEGNHRISSFAAPGDRATLIPRDDPIRRLQQNSGFEALFNDADGVVYAIPERSGQLDRPFPIHRWKDGAWSRPYSVPREGEFLVTGADLGPDNKLFVLERDVGLLGFRSRIRMFDFDPETGPTNAVTLIETTMGQLDNMEGISAWADEDGNTRLTLISDDNFFPLQRTEIVEFILRDPPPSDPE